MQYVSAMVKKQTDKRSVNTKSNIYISQYLQYVPLIDDQM